MFISAAISCGHPGIPARGRARIGGLTFKQSVWFECDDFYELYGESELTCEEDGLWSDDLPECVPGMNQWIIGLLKPVDEAVGRPS